MNATAKSVFAVAALLIVMTIAWHFIAAGLQSNSLASVVANTGFCVLLAASVYMSRIPRTGLATAYALATIFAILLGIVAGFVGMIVYESNHAIGDALMQSFSLGYYPPGPDVPFELGVVVWGLSIALLIALGFAIGVAVRKVCGIGSIEPAA